MMLSNEVSEGSLMRPQAALMMISWSTLMRFYERTAERSLLGFYDMDTDIDFKRLFWDCLMYFPRA